MCRIVSEGWASADVAVGILALGQEFGGEPSCSVQKVGGTSIGSDEISFWLTSMDKSSVRAPISLRFKTSHFAVSLFGHPGTVQAIKTMHLDVST